MLAGMLTVGSYQLVALAPWSRFVIISSPLMGVFVLLPCGQLHWSLHAPSYLKGMSCAGATMLIQTSWEFETYIELFWSVMLILSYLTLQWITATQMLLDLAPSPHVSNRVPNPVR